jgi:SAM-dependent methyltransferase
MSLISVTDPDRAWEQFGQENPYFGVVTEARYLSSNLNDESIEEFFRSGESHVEHVCRVLRAKTKPQLQLDRVLDYGCGVGRLAVPFAKRFRSVVGVDVSPAMLAHARKNCERLAVDNAQFIHTSELSSLAPGSFDLVHSYIVFQHIPPSRGERILSDIVALIADGGVGAIHFAYAFDWRPMRRLLYEVRSRSGIVHSILNMAQGKKFSRPFMQMNNYSINRVLDVLYRAGCSNVHIEFSDHFGWRGAMVYFEKNSAAPSVNPVLFYSHK